MRRSRLRDPGGATASAWPNRSRATAALASSSRLTVSDAYGTRHPQVRALRDLARDHGARAAAGACLLEGPRVITAALERGADLAAVYFGHGAQPAFPRLVLDLEEAGIPVRDLKEGVLEKIGTTRTPQPVLGVARWMSQPLADLLAAAADGFVVVTVDVADPGNLGTILRSAEAAGVAGVVVSGSGVDVRNPKVVRSSAGALFGLAVAEVPDAGVAIDALRSAGLRCLGAVARGGAAPVDIALARRCAIIVGNEARGISPAVQARLDGTVTIPMAGMAESLNVAMAVTVLCFEAARQRAASTERGDL